MRRPLRSCRTTRTSWRLLRGAEQLGEVRRVEPPQRLRARLTQRFFEPLQRIPAAFWVRVVRAEEEELFQRLRDLRRGIADRQGVPAYVVFSDKVLREMVARHPRTASDLLDVSGVGPTKLERYGDAFLGALGES